MVDEFKWRLCHLHRSKGSTRPLIRNILKKDPKLDFLYNLTTIELSQAFHLPHPRASTLFQDLHSSTVQHQLEQDFQKYSIYISSELKFPPLLKLIPDSPIVLYSLGNILLAHQLPAIAVVGTRDYSLEAKSKIKFLLKPLISKDWIIVSGMAKGIDTLAHQYVLEQKGKTIAVLGFGFEHIYPRENKALMSTLGQTQLLLSEYPPTTQAKPWHFPERNRLISGLSFATLVIEAKERSGSLITADQALEQGREVFAVPGSIFNKQSRGCHKIIQEGAKIVQNTYEMEMEWDELRDKWCRIMSENKNYLNN